ncbi:hypothetical protein GH714_016256 [Hevea brasiliensis]|uniref:PB1 domain-containing protein n=1 Tax=Hevea brasiliensis TaxID=3981 RepID=A0A6A6ME77_HEVBR|nr:hypothetical protein GH714_016256 [Hevea brasiliensis]
MKEQPVSRLRRKSTTTTTASASSSRSIKLICSFNGSFHFRPPSNKLRYIGGETRIISVDRNIGFFKLLNKMSDLCPKLRSFSLKYQLPMYGSESGSRRARDPESDLETGVPLVSIAPTKTLGHRLHPLNPKDGNLHGKRIVPRIVCQGKNFRNLGQGTLSHLNRENIMLWTTVCALRNSHWGGSTYPAKSPFSSGGHRMESET